ncbi:hypothetical protein CAPTEDRAFT_80474, partial [Capitella teleta]
QVLQRIRESNLKLKKGKCKIKQTQVEYVGHKITQEGMKPGDELVHAIMEMSTPGNAGKLHRFTAMVS